MDDIEINNNKNINSNYINTKIYLEFEHKDKHKYMKIFQKGYQLEFLNRLATRYGLFLTQHDNNR